MNIELHKYALKKGRNVIILKELLKEKENLRLIGFLNERGEQNAKSSHDLSRRKA